MQKLDNVVVQPDEVADAMRRGIELIHPFDADESMPYTNYAAPPTGPPQSYQVRTGRNGRGKNVLLTHPRHNYDATPSLSHFDVMTSSK